MPKHKLKAERGFTVVELMVATLIAAIVILGAGVLLVEGQRGWSTMRARIHSDVAADSYVARKTFDSVTRQASKERILLDDTGNWIEVHYCADPNSTDADRYARFYVADGELNLERGILNPRETLTVQTVCENASNCVFRATGRSAQMMLTLDNGSQTATVFSSAFIHNEQK
jgi:prepilin-type N-terminal cleavage/methylation domain-containing protein